MFVIGSVPGFNGFYFNRDVPECHAIDVEVYSICKICAIGN